MDVLSILTGTLILITIWYTHHFYSTNDIDYMTPSTSGVAVQEVVPAEEGTDSDEPNYCELDMSTYDDHKYGNA